MEQLIDTFLLFFLIILYKHLNNIQIDKLKGIETRTWLVHNI